MILVSMESLLSPLQFLLEALLSFEVIFILIFHVEIHVSSFDPFYQNDHKSRFKIAMRVRFVPEFSRLQGLQLSFQRVLSKNMLKDLKHFVQSDG